MGEDDGIFLLLWSIIIRPERVKDIEINVFLTAKVLLNLMMQKKGMSV